MTALLQAALAVAAMGYPVFPCKRDKSPACEHGFKDAKRNEAGIGALFANNNAAKLVGVPTGTVSGFDVLDIDPKNGGEAWLNQSRNALPITRMHRTRSEGFHFLFRHLDGVKSSAGKLAAGVDTRGEGGYIIWWPAHGFAVEAGEVIDYWPEWLQTALLPLPNVDFERDRPTTKAIANSQAKRMLENAYDRVRNAVDGQRHYQLRAAACTIGGILDYITISEETIINELVNRAMEAGGIDNKNAEDTAKWGLKKGKLTKLITVRN